MDASATHTFPAPHYPIPSHRTPSFSSLSSSSSIGSSEYFSDDSLLTPAAAPLRFSGVPFSWEHFPGVPKNKLQNGHKKKNSMNSLPLPLPPPASRTISKNQNTLDDVGFLRNWFSSHKDPFVAAFLECSKGRDRDGGRDRSRTRLGDRFGFLDLYVSCKKTCVVSDSVVYLPRPRRTSYGLITHHSSP